MNKVLFFAELQEKTGTESIEMDAKGKTIKELKGLIEEKYTLSALNQAMTAVNEEFAHKETVIKENDTIAFIPPVSGG